MQSTYTIAMAAGCDAANRQMRAAGRPEWDESDWNLAADVAAHLMDDLPAPPILKLARRPLATP